MTDVSNSTSRNSRAFRRRALNSVFIFLCYAAAAVAVGALALLFYSLITKGFGGLSINVFTKDATATGEDGGLLNGILGSIVLCVLGMVFAIVIGILAGTWLSEYARDSKLGSVIRFLNDVLLSAPSILIGLAVYIYAYKIASAVGDPKLTYSGLAGGFALGLLAIPIVVRTTEDMLKLQPAALREAGGALGASRGTVIRKIIWRAGRTGLLTGCLLGFARMSGETAPLFFTAFGNPEHFHFNALSDLIHPVSALPLVINDLVRQGSESAFAMAWTGALLISLAVLSVNILGRYLARGAKS